MNRDVKPLPKKTLKDFETSERNLEDEGDRFGNLLLDYLFYNLKFKATNHNVLKLFFNFVFFRNDVCNNMEDVYDKIHQGPTDDESCGDEV